MALVLVLVMVLIAAVLLAFASGRHVAPRLRRRHVVTRIICGSLGVAILAAVGIGSWLDVAASSQPPAPPLVSARIPTLPAPLPKAKPNETTMIEKGRLLWTMFLFKCVGDQQLLIAAQQQELRIPEKQSGQATIKADEVELNTIFSFAQAGSVLHNGQPAIKLLCASQNMSWYSNWMFSSSGGAGAGAGDQTGDMLHFNMTVTNGTHPLVSIWPRPRSTYYPVGIVHLLEPNDPLKEAPANELLAGYREQLPGISTDMVGLSDASLARGSPAGLSLATHLGLSALLLVAAAGLLAQLFSHRGFAFAGMLAAVVLCVAAMDRCLLVRQLDTAADAKAPLTTRILACQQATNSFFYRHTGAGAMRTIAADPAAPEMLRRIAERAGQELERPGSTATLGGAMPVQRVAPTAIVSPG